VEIQPQWVVTPGKQTNKQTNKHGEGGSYCLHLQGDSVWLDAVTSHYIPFNFITYCLVKSENYEPVYFAVLKIGDLFYGIISAFFLTNWAILRNALVRKASLWNEIKMWDI
jgi:hypothetical protein